MDPRRNEIENLQRQSFLPIERVIQSNLYMTEGNICLYQSFLTATRSIRCFQSKSQQNAHYIHLRYADDTQ